MEIRPFAHYVTVLSATNIHDPLAVSFYSQMLTLSHQT
jgi:hypothetical protein